MGGAGDECEATWRQDAKLVPVPKIDPSIQLSGWAPPGVKGGDRYWSAQTNLPIFNRKAGEVIRQLPDEVDVVEWRTGPGMNTRPPGDVTRNWCLSRE